MSRYDEWLTTDSRWYGSLWVVTEPEMTSRTEDGDIDLFDYSELKCGRCHAHIGWWDDGYTEFYTDETQSIKLCENCQIQIHNNKQGAK